MILIFFAPLLCALALAACSAEVARRVPAARGAAVLVVAGLLAAASADLALAILVGARLLDAAPVAELLGWGPERPGPIPVPTAISLLAGLGLTGAAAAAIVDWIRSRDAARWLGELDRSAPSGELVVVRSPTAFANAIPGGRQGGLIVVSDSMLRALTPPERRVVLAHERAHLRHRHDRYRRLARLSARLNPLLLPSVAATDFLLERWADEDAAAAVGSRRLVARALARAALIPAPGGLSHDGAGFATRGVVGRVDALLLGESPRCSRTALLLPAGLAIIASFAAIVSAHDLAHLFDLLRGDG